MQPMLNAPKLFTPLVIAIDSLESGTHRLPGKAELLAPASQKQHLQLCFFRGSEAAGLELMQRGAEQVTQTWFRCGSDNFRGRLLPLVEDEHQEPEHPN